MVGVRVAGGPGLTVHPMSAQVPHRRRCNVAFAFVGVGDFAEAGRGLAQQAAVVIPTIEGGAFGGACDSLYPLEQAASGVVIEVSEVVGEVVEGSGCPLAS